MNATSIQITGNICSGGRGFDENQDMGEWL